jgi:hypothetical protein
MPINGNSSEITSKQGTIVSLLTKPLTLRVSGSTRVVCFLRRNDASNSQPPEV